MTEIPAVISLTVGILGVLGLFAGSAAFFRSKRGEALISLQDKTITEQHRRLELVEKDREVCQRRLDVLEDMVTGKVAIEQLAELVTERHAEVIRRLDSLIKKR